MRVIRHSFWVVSLDSTDPLLSSALRVGLFHGSQARIRSGSTADGGRSNFNWLYSLYCEKILLVLWGKIHIQATCDVDYNPSLRYLWRNPLMKDTNFNGPEAVNLAALSTWFPWVSLASPRSFPFRVRTECRYVGDKNWGSSILRTTHGQHTTKRRAGCAQAISKQ